jgi:hypothetical protein
MFMPTTTTYSFKRQTLSRLINHRLFVVPLLLLVTIVAGGTAAATVINSTPIMETDAAIRSRIDWSKQGVAKEYVWWLRDLDNRVYGSTEDYDRVYLRTEGGGGGFQSILIKTGSRNSSEKKNNSISFTVTEFDMLNILLTKTYTEANPKQTIFNGRRRVLMEKIGLEEERVQFTLFKYSLKNDTWKSRDSVSLPTTKVKTLLNTYRKIQDKVESYGDGLGFRIISGTSSSSGVSSDDCYHDSPIRRRSSKKIPDIATAGGGEGPATLVSSTLPTTNVSGSSDNVEDGA